MKALGIDFGEKRVGIALSDAGGRMAFAHGTLANRGARRLVEEIRALVDRERVEVVVIGMPYGTDGSVGPAAERVERFARRLDDALTHPVERWDERYSTCEAEATLRAADVHGARRREVVDQVSAAIILQEFLDARAHGTASGSDGAGPGLAPHG